MFKFLFGYSFISKNEGLLMKL